MKNELLNDLMSLANDGHAAILSRFFKTGKGQYGAGDKFIGIKVPNQRKIAKKYYKHVSLDDINELISNPYHEVRLTCLIILTYKMKEANYNEQEDIVKLYLKNSKYINNWDLVDISAPNILGYYLYENKLDRKILYKLANSNDLWKQRIAMLSTHYFIKHNDYDDTLAIATILLNHKHDLIHKAVGWMLREIGNYNYEVEYNYLIKNYKNMPRTMLRYAIEKFDTNIRGQFLNNEL